MLIRVHERPCYLRCSGVQGPLSGVRGRQCRDDAITARAALPVTLSPDAAPPVSFCLRCLVSLLGSAAIGTAAATSFRTRPDWHGSVFCAFSGSHHTSLMKSNVSLSLIVLSKQISYLQTG